MKTVSQREKASSYRVALVNITMVVLMLVVVSLLLYVSDRGLDLADESFYLLFYKRPNDVIGGLSGFGHVLHPVYRLLGEDLVLLRRAGILVLSGVGFLLGIAVNRYLESNFRSRIVGMEALMGTTALLLYSSSTFTPGYNWLNLLGMMIAVTAVIEIRTTSVIRRGNAVPRLFVLAVSAAIGTMITIFAKPTTGLAMLCFCTASLLLQRECRKPLLLWYLVFVPLLYIGAAAWLWGSLFNFWKFMKWGLTLSSLTESYSLSSLPINTVHALFQGFKGVMRSVLYSPVLSATLAGVLIVMAVIWWMHKATPVVSRRRALGRWGASGGALVWIALLSIGKLKGGWPPVAHNGFVLGVLFVPALSLLVYMVLGRKSAVGSGTSVHWFLAMALCSLPVLFWIGSGNGVVPMSLAAGVFLVLGGTLLLALTDPDAVNCRSMALYKYSLMVVTFVILTSMTCRLYVLSMVSAEYSAYTMKQQVVLADGNSVKVTEELGHYLAQQQEIGRQAGVAAGDYLINLSAGNCGINLVWGTRPFGFPWLLNEQVAIAVLNAQDRKTVTQSWLLTSERVEKASHGWWLRPLSTSVLESLGLNFPGGYRVEGQAFNPITRATEILWRPIRPYAQDKPVSSLPPVGEPARR